MSNALTATRPSILVVDNDEAAGKKLQSVISRLDADTFLAIGKKEALAMFGERVYALAIIEAELPDSTGFELAIELRQKSQHLPVIFISGGKIAQKFVIEGYVAGGVDYILRPVNDYVLLSKIEVFLRLERQRLQLLGSNQDLRDFAHVASHDLKSPLNLILGFSTLVEKELKDNLNEQAKDYLQRIKNASKRMSDLINDLLTYAEIEAREKTFDRLDARKLVDAILENFAYEIEKGEARVDVVVSGDLDADPVLFRQVLENLVGNAIKYRADNRHPHVHIKGRLEDQSYIFEVKDNGRGFEPADIQKIFQPFRRLATDLPGSGLGLSIVKRIVDYHSGKITVHSKPGEGSEFIIEIPVNNEA